MDPSFKTMINYNKATEYDTEYKIEDNLNLNEIYKIISLKKYKNFIRYIS